MPIPDEALDAYVAMWNTADEGRRRALASQALTEDAVVLYPTIEAHGRVEALAAATRWHQELPGVQIVLTSGITHHHGWFRVAWRVVDAGGSAGVEGQNIGELAEDGRLRRTIGFLDPLPGRP